MLLHTAFNAGVSLNSAFLSELAKTEAFGKVSGWGWGFGYLGGILSLGVCLMIVFAAQDSGKSAEDYVPLCMLSTAAIFMVVSLPMLLCVKERSKPSGLSFEKTVKNLWVQERSSFAVLDRKSVV